MKDRDLVRRAALTDMMALPDPPGLRRGRHQTQEGKPDRLDLWADLPNQYRSWLRLQLDSAQSAVWSAA